MADITSLDLLNQTQIELLQKYDGALNRFNEINNYFEDGKAIEAINAENALKFNGLKLYATMNEDGSFNDDGIFKIKEVNGKKVLAGVLDVNMYMYDETYIPVFDIFGDGSCVALYEFNGNVNDTSGVYNAEAHYIEYCIGKFGRAVQSISDNSQVIINNLPFDSNTEVVTISAWIKWNGNNGVMAFGWDHYDLYFLNGYIGFNTGNSDFYGTSSSGFVNTWKHVVVEFRKGEYGKIWTDSRLQSLSQIMNTIKTENAYMGNILHIFGWGENASSRYFGCVDHLRIFNRALTDDEVKILYNEGA